MKVSKVIGVTELPQKYYALIGNILVEWGWLEHRVREAVGHLLRVDLKTGRAITAEVDVRGLATALASLASHRIRDPEISAEAVALANNLKKKLPERNRIVHGTWIWNPTSRKATVREFRGNPITGSNSEYDLPRLSNFLAWIQRSRVRLQELLDSA